MSATKPWANRTKAFLVRWKWLLILYFVAVSTSTLVTARKALEPLCAILKEWLQKMLVCS